MVQGKVKFLPFCKYTQFFQPYLLSYVWFALILLNLVHQLCLCRSRIAFTRQLFNPTTKDFLFDFSTTCLKWSKKSDSVAGRILHASQSFVKLCELYKPYSSLFPLCLMLWNFMSHIYVLVFSLYMSSPLCWFLGLFYYLYPPAFLQAWKFPASSDILILEPVSTEKDSDELPGILYRPCCLECVWKQKVSVIFFPTSKQTISLHNR